MSIFAEIKMSICFINDLPCDLFHKIIWETADGSKRFFKLLMDVVLIETDRQNFLNMIYVCKLWYSTLTDIHTMPSKMCRVDTIFLSILIGASKKSSIPQMLIYNEIKSNEFGSIINCQNVSHELITILKWCDFYYLSAEYVNLERSGFKIPTKVVLEQYDILEKFFYGLNFCLGRSSNYKTFNDCLIYRIAVLEKKKRDTALNSEGSIKYWIGQNIFDQLSFSDSYIFKEGNFDCLLNVFRLLEPYRYKYKWESTLHFIRLIQVLILKNLSFKKRILDEIWKLVIGWYEKYKADETWHIQMKKTYRKIIKNICLNLKTMAKKNIIFESEIQKYKYYKRNHLSN